MQRDLQDGPRTLGYLQKIREIQGDLKGDRGCMITCRAILDGSWE